jgi:ribosomal protein L18E
VTQSIIPHLALREMIKHWQHIAERLKEAPRKRRTQVEAFLS